MVETNEEIAYADFESPEGLCKECILPRAFDLRVGPAVQER